jgi:excisionase family DNA binding protein
MFDMSHPSYLREHARRLRAEKRLTIDELAERLALSRSTVYYWVRDMPIPGSGPGGGFSSEGQRKGTRAMKRKYRLLREAAYREGVGSYAELAEDPTFRDFVCLYIGEGYKRDRNRVALANSDPMVILHATRWVRRLSDRSPVFWLQFHADQDPGQLSRFWSDLLDAPSESVRLLRKSNSNQLTGRIWRSRYGVLSVTVGDTYLRARLQAWMDLTQRSWK